MAIEYKKDSGHAYWGTPLVPTSFAGSHAVNGVVSGNAVSTFSGDNLGPMTIDWRTLTTNYNVADNATGAQELWLRSGFEWTPLNNVTVKDQVYYYQAQRNWLDSETYAFDDGAVFAPGVIDRDRFFVTHNQHVVGDNIDFLWDSRLFGMDNRLAAQLQVSGNWITFVEEGDPNDYPYDFVSVVDPAQGVYGPEFPDTRNRTLDDVAAAFEDRLKITPEFALIGGVRVDDWTLTSNGIDFDGSIPAGEPFTQTWRPVSYRAAYTYEPIPNLMFYSMYATSYDPAAADVFSVNPNSSLALTSAQIYETGVKQLFWDNKAEWTFAAYDITRRNVYVQIRPDDVRSRRRNRHQGRRNGRRGASDRRLEALGQCCLDRRRVTRISISRASPATRPRTWRRSSSMPARPIVSSIGDGRLSSAPRCATSATAIFLKTTPRPWTPIRRRMPMRSWTFPARIWGGPTSRPCASRSACAT